MCSCRGRTKRVFPTRPARRRNPPRGRNRRTVAAPGLPLCVHLSCLKKRERFKPLIRSADAGPWHGRMRELARWSAASPGTQNKIKNETEQTVSNILKNCERLPRLCTKKKTREVKRSRGNNSHVRRGLETGRAKAGVPASLSLGLGLPGRGASQAPGGPTPAAARPGHSGSRQSRKNQRHEPASRACRWRGLHPS